MISIERHRRADMAAAAAFQRPHDQPAQIFRALVQWRRDAVQRAAAGFSGIRLITLSFPRGAVRAIGARDELPRLASLHAGSGRRRRRGVCHRSGRNSFNRIRHPAQPNSGIQQRKPRREHPVLAVKPAGRAREGARCSDEASGMPGCSSMSAVSFDGIVPAEIFEVDERQ